MFRFTPSQKTPWDRGGFTDSDMTVVVPMVAIMHGSLDEGNPKSCGHPQPRLTKSEADGCEMRSNPRVTSAHQAEAVEALQLHRFLSDVF